MLKKTFGIFANPNFRWLYTGDFLTFTGFWLAYINMGWLTYSLTHSPFALGALGFITNIPVLLIMPFSGVFADRVDKRKILLVAQVFYFIPTLLLAWYGFHNSYTYTLLAISSFLFGAIFASSFPAGNSYASELVTSKMEIQKAISLIRTNSRTTMVVSSALNGLLHLIVSFAGVFITSFLIFIGALISFLKIKKPSTTTSASTHSAVITQLKEGFHHVFTFAPFWSTILLAAIATNLGNAYSYQLPSFAAQTLHGNIHTLSYLYIASGLGAVFAAIYLATFQQSQHLMKKACFALIIFGLSLVAFSLSHQLSLSLCITVIIGFSEIFVNGVCAATLQVICDEDKRGRVMGCFGFVVLGLIPFSNLAMGSLGALLKPAGALIIFGSFCVFAAFYYLIQMPRFRILLQPLYQQKEIDLLNQPI